MDLRRHWRRPERPPKSGLGPNDALRLQLITEEMLCLVRSVTGEIEAGFWIEAEDRKYTMHLLTKTSMDKEKRYQLISSSTSRRNEAAKGFLGKLRDIETGVSSDHDGLSLGIVSVVDCNCIVQTCLELISQACVSCSDVILLEHCQIEILH